jgi:energy-coupling factor transporter ATP-binding protein EcfA2
MIEYNDTLEFHADKPILVMDKLCKNYQLGSTQLRVLREIDLSIHSGAEILKILVDLHMQGKTLIIVTHDRDVSVTAKRVVGLLDGRIARQHYN